MLSLSPAIRIFLCLSAVDLRKSFDGLSALVRQALGADPLSGHWFVFRNRVGDRLKILAGNRRAKWTHIGAQNGPTGVQGYTYREGLSGTPPGALHLFRSGGVATLGSPGETESGSAGTQPDKG